MVVGGGLAALAGPAGRVAAAAEGEAAGSSSVDGEKRRPSGCGDRARGPRLASALHLVLGPGS